MALNATLSNMFIPVKWTKIQKYPHGIIIIILIENTTCYKIIISYAFYNYYNILITEYSVNLSFFGSD